MHCHYLFGGGNSYTSKLKPPCLLAGGIECLVSPWDLPPSRWHDIYVLDELFYIYVQIRNSQRVDDKFMFTYEILCVSANQCTDQQNGVEKTSMPDALALLNMNDVHHLEHLVWAVYDGMLLVGPRPKLLGNCSWCTVLARLHKHIYRDCEDVAHCPPQMLGSWDCQELIEVLW